MPPLQGKLSDLLTKIAPGGGAVQLQQATTTNPSGGVQKNHHQPQLIQSVNGVIRKLQLNPMQLANGLGKPAGSADVKIKAFQVGSHKSLFCNFHFDMENTDVAVSTSFIGPK